MNFTIPSISKTMEYQLFDGDHQKRIRIPNWKTVQDLSEYIPSTAMKASYEVNEHFLVAADRKIEDFKGQIKEKILSGAYCEVDAIAKEKLKIEKQLHAEEAKISKDFETYQQIMPLKAKALLAKKQADYSQAAKCYKQICDISQSADDWGHMLNFANQHFTSVVPTLCQRILNDSFAPDWLKESAGEKMSELSDQINTRSYPAIKEDNGQLAQLILRSGALQDRNMPQEMRPKRQDRQS